KLEEFRAQLELSYQLATIKTDVELPYQLTDLMIKTPDNAQLAELYKECEFRRWLSEVLSNEPVAAKPQTGAAQADMFASSDDTDSTTQAVGTAPDNYLTVLDEAAFNSMLQQLHRCELVAFDTETTSLDYMQAELVGL